MTQIFDLKQPVAAAMASGHTHGVCPKSGTIKTGMFYIWKTENMQQRKPGFLIIYHRNYTNLSLHSQPTIDINPIVKVIITGPYQRHCSTTFYQ